MPIESERKGKYVDLQFEITEERSDAIGTAWLAFDGADGTRVEGQRIEVQCGLLGTWEIGFQARQEIPEGAIIAFERASWSGFQFDYRQQDFNPQGRAYVTFEAQASALLECLVNTDNPSHRRPVAAVRVAQGRMQPGDTFCIRIGDRRFGGEGICSVDTPLREQRVLVGAAMSVGEPLRQLPGSPLVINLFVDPVPYRYYAIAPTIVPPGEPFGVRVFALSQAGCVAEGCREEVTLGPCEGVEGLPVRRRFEHADAGIMLVEGLQCDTPGVYRIAVRDRAGRQAETNPIIVRDTQERVFWGDLHVHAYDASEMRTLTPSSDPENVLEFARRAGLDFAAIASHIFTRDPEAASTWWPVAKEAIEAVHQEGQLVVFQAYEWRGDGADQNVYFRTPRDEPFDPTIGKIRKLQQLARGQDVFIVPHGHAFDGANPERRVWDIEPSLTPFVEICSGHSNFEWLGQRFLSLGGKVGFIGSSDNHAGDPGVPRRVRAYGGRFDWMLERRDGATGIGYAAVRAEELTREALWEALRNRHCYATTGARIYADCRIGDAGPGGEIELEEPPRLRIEVHGTADVMRVDVIRGAERLHSEPGDGRDMCFEVADPAPSAEALYYVRVVQVDREYAWTSPIFVRMRTPADAATEPLPPWNADEEPDIAPEDRKAAAKYLPDVMRYLSIHEHLDRFSEFIPARVIAAHYGAFALFYTTEQTTGRRISLRWFFEFPIARLRFDVGWLDYGKGTCHLND